MAEEINMRDTIGQNRVKEILQSSKEKDRLAHAYLFYGQSGVGKDNLAISFAMGLNCKEKKLWGCSSCISCKSIRDLQQPGFIFIQPVPSLPKLMKQDIYYDLIRQRALHHINNPYDEVTFNPELTTLPKISIDVIKTIKRNVRLKSAKDTHRIFLISHADQMTKEACNSVLKILEEPPPKTIIILTTSKLGKMLPTITSRCQLIRFDPLSEEEIKQAMIKNFKISLEKANFLAKIAGGSLQKAEEIINAGFEETRSSALNFLEDCLNHDELISLTAVETFVKQRDKIETIKILKIVQLLVRDIFQIQIDLPHQLINIDVLKKLENFIKKYPDFDSEKALKHITGSIDLIEKNVYLQLIVFNLHQNLRKC